jgi:ribosome assembly protein 1
VEEFLIMRGFDLGVIAALWPLFSQFAYGQHVGGGEAITYSRELLLALRPLAVSDNILHIPRSLRINSLQAAASGILSKKQRRKRGRRGGVQRRLRKYGLRDRRRLPALPTILLSNVQSIRNKMDELEAYARCKHDFRETCLLAFTETWLGDADPNEDLHITGFGYPVRMDRSPLITNKSRGGGVCFYINERYCNTVVVREKICTPDLELLFISIRPFYLPREFTQFSFTLVYIHPRANVA